MSYSQSFNLVCSSTSQLQTPEHPQTTVMLFYHYSQLSVIRANYLSTSVSHVYGTRISVYVTVYTTNFVKFFCARLKHKRVSSREKFFLPHFPRLEQIIVITTVLANVFFGVLWIAYLLQWTSLLQVKNQSDRDHASSQLLWTIQKWPRQILLQFAHLFVATTSVLN